MPDTCITSINISGTWGLYHRGFPGDARRALPPNYNLRLVPSLVSGVMGGIFVGFYLLGGGGGGGGGGG